jgi:hypothetical protein
VAQGKDNDRIVWTYNAPLSDLQAQQQLQALQQQQQQNSSESNSISPNSPTSVSSSVMSSDNSSSKRIMLLNSMDGEVNNGDYSEAISSPDFQVPFCSFFRFSDETDAECCCFCLLNLNHLWLDLLAFVSVSLF